MSQCLKFQNPKPHIDLRNIALAVISGVTDVKVYKRKEKSCESKNSKFRILITSRKHDLLEIVTDIANIV